MKSGLPKLGLSRTSPTPFSGGRDKVYYAVNNSPIKRISQIALVSRPGNTLNSRLILRQAQDEWYHVILSVHGELVESVHGEPVEP